MATLKKRPRKNRIDNDFFGGRGPSAQLTAKNSANAITEVKSIKKGVQPPG